MSNAVATLPKGNLPDLHGAANAHETEASNHKGPKQFLKFSKGDYSLGKEGTEFADNKFHFVPAMDMWEKGWQCWKNGMPIDQHFVAYGQPVPKKSELEDHGPYVNQNDGWQESIKFPLMILPGLGGHDTVFMNCEFAASSTGGKNACYALSKAYSQWIKEGKVTQDLPYVIVEASGDSYKHPTYGKVHFPVFTLVKAVSVADLEKIVGGAAQKVESDPVPGDAPAEAAPPVKAEGSTAKPTKAKAGAAKAPFDL